MSGHSFVVQDIASVASAATATSAAATTTATAGTAPATTTAATTATAGTTNTGSAADKCWSQAKPAVLSGQMEQPDASSPRAPQSFELFGDEFCDFGGGFEGGFDDGDTYEFTSPESMLHGGFRSPDFRSDTPSSNPSVPLPHSTSTALHPAFACHVGSSLNGEKESFAPQHTPGDSANLAQAASSNGSTTPTLCEATPTPSPAESNTQVPPDADEASLSPDAHEPSPPPPPPLRSNSLNNANGGSVSARKGDGQQVAEQRPAEQSSKVQSSLEQSSQVQSPLEQSSQVQSSLEQSSQVQSSLEQSSLEQSSPQQPPLPQSPVPSQVGPIDEQRGSRTATEPTAPTATQPTATQPATIQTSGTQRADSERTTTQPTATQPTTTQTTTAQSTITQPADSQPTTTQSTATQPTTTQSTTSQHSTTQPTAAPITQPTTAPSTVRIDNEQRLGNLRVLVKALCRDAGFLETIPRTRDNEPFEVYQIADSSLTILQLKCLSQELDADLCDNLGLARESRRYFNRCAFYTAFFFERLRTLVPYVGQVLNTVLAGFPNARQKQAISLGEWLLVCGCRVQEWCACKLVQVVQVCAMRVV